MEPISEIVSQICEQVLGESAVALRAIRLHRRHLRLIEPQVISVEQAEVYDLNQVVWNIVEEAIPLCRAINVHLLLQQDPRLPAVPMLVRPMEDALSAALDLCLDGESSLLRVRTRTTPDRAIATLERWSRSAKEDPRESRSMDPQDWQDAGDLGQVELIIGDRASRALGGRFHILRRSGGLRFQLELPTGLHQNQTRLAGIDRARPGICAPFGFALPGLTSERQVL